MRAFDGHAIESGVPGIVLMENAGRGAAHLIGLKLRPRIAGAGHERSESPVYGSCVRCADEKSLLGGRVLIVCGPGNNGGDGFVVGRQLLGRAASVRLALCVPRDSLKGDAALAATAFEAVGGSTTEVSRLEDVSELLGDCDLVVDGILGTGVQREVTGFFREVIVAISNAGRFVVSLDLPSGLDADTGAVHGVAVRADHTITFGHLKTGLLSTAGAEHCGRITVSHIGVVSTLPAAIEPVAFLLEESDVTSRLVPRAVVAHKKSVGRVAVLGGSEGMVGALQLAGLAALRAGAGLSTLVSTNSVIDKLEGQVRELMTARHDPGGSDSTQSSVAPSVLEEMDALVIGPGLGRGPVALKRAQAGLLAAKPTVLDADGLRAFEGRLGELKSHPSLILTPHAGEAAGLLDITSGEVEADRFAAVRRIADESGATVVLKGPRTLIHSPGGPVFVSAFGTPALATGGTGDVLAGLIAGLLATAVRRPDWRPEATGSWAWVGVALHGLSAEAWSKVGGSSGMVAGDLLERIPQVMHGLLAAR
jgi:NAD(P)H-hydrate epimerase